MIRKLALIASIAFLVVLFPMLAFAQGALPTADDPAVAGSFVYRLYKAGHFVPAIIVGVFFGLTIAQKRIAWLRVGYRKVAVSAAIAGFGMLAERVASGTTPNIGMLAGAIGAAFTMWMQTQGEPKADKAADPS
jgi:hypothetical protein